MPKVVRFHETGSADVLKIENLPLEEPREYEVRIKVDAIGLNRAEVMFRQGQYLEEPELPAKLGYEASGVVDAVGERVTSVQVGDKVSTIPAHSINQYGVYGEYAVVPEISVAKYPENLSPIEGTAIWMQYLTGYFPLFEIARLGAGQHILITAASSSTGIAAIQMAKAVHATAIATTRKEDKVQELLDAGADHVVVTEKENLVEKVNQITHGKGAEVIYDPIGGPQLAQLGEVIAQRGRLFLYGALSQEPTIFPLFPVFMRSAHFHVYKIFEFTGAPSMNLSPVNDAVERAKQFIYYHLENETFRPQIDKNQFTLDQIADAHRYMESNQQVGKIVVTV